MSIAEILGRIRAKVALSWGSYQRLGDECVRYKVGAWDKIPIALWSRGMAVAHSTGMGQVLQEERWATVDPYRYLSQSMGLGARSRELDIAWWGDRLEGLIEAYHIGWGVLITDIGITHTTIEYVGLWWDQVWQDGEMGMNEGLKWGHIRQQAGDCEEDEQYSNSQNPV